MTMTTTNGTPNSDDALATVEMLARLGDTVAEHGDDLYDLRKELADLRAQLATEVRTQRLVVIGPAGDERIATACSEGRSVLRLDAEGDDVGFGGPQRTTIELLATVGESVEHDGEIGSAMVMLTTGDDSYTTVQQTATMSSEGLRVTEHGSVELYQHDHLLRAGQGFVTTHLRRVVVDENGH